jgi:hypothetical protein
MKDTNKIAHGNLRHFDTHRELCPSEEHEYMWTHREDRPCSASLLYVHLHSCSSD